MWNAVRQNIVAASLNLALARSILAVAVLGGPLVDSVDVLRTWGTNFRISASTFGEVCGHSELTLRFPGVWFTCRLAARNVKQLQAH